MRAFDVMVHQAVDDGSRWITETPRTGVIPRGGARQASLGTLLQHPLLADAARYEPRLYLIFARAQQHAGRSYADRISTAAELKEQTHDLAGWGAVLGQPGSAAQLALAWHTIDRLLLLARLPIDHEVEAGPAVAL